jgi:predicted ArsR family transcriptional regulator
VPSEPIDLSSHKALAGVSRVAILEVLRAGMAAQDVQAIAAQVGLHTNTVRTHLDQLVEAGLVESSVEVRTTPGRPRVLFRVSASAPAAEAGRRWGRTVVASDGPAHGSVDAAHGVERIVALLDEVGFAPRVSASSPTGPTFQSGDGAQVRATVIELHRCPFRDVALEHADVVCGVHLGLMQGALEQMGAPAASIRLEPFVRPGLCLAHVSPADTVDAIGTGGAA